MFFSIKTEALNLEKYLRYPYEIHSLRFDIFCCRSRFNIDRIGLDWIRFLIKMKSSKTC